MEFTKTEQDNMKNVEDKTNKLNSCGDNHCGHIITSESLQEKEKDFLGKVLQLCRSTEPPKNEEEDKKQREEYNTCFTKYKNCSTYYDKLTQRKVCEEQNCSIEKKAVDDAIDQGKKDLRETKGGSRKSKKSKKSKSITKINLRYLPKKLSKEDRQRQVNMLFKSRKLYKKGNYFTRKKLSSFQSKKSNHITDAQRIYKLDKIAPSKELSRATGCSINSLSKIMKKGQGAYFSSGSRPNQTAQSWGLARLASSITGGKAAAVDFKILEEGCKKNSKALSLAKKSRKKNHYGTRRVPKVRV